MKQFWSPGIDALAPYVPGEQPQDQQYIKLNTNENPYGPSPQVLAAINKANNEALRLYPDPESVALKQALADYHKVDITQIFVGNGSDEVLAHSFQAFFQQNKPLCYPDVTYSFYPVYAQLYNVDVNIVPLDAAMQINIDDYPPQNGGIIFPNPNAPTGRLLPLDEIRRLLTKNRDSVVIVDEAYIDFGGDSAIALTNEFDNLLVVQTYSKSRALAGMRLGYAIGHRHLIEALQRVKNSFNSYPIDRLTQAAGIASLADEAHFQKACADTIATREWTVKQLEALGFHVMPSAANFVLAKHQTQSGEAIYQHLKTEGVLLRYFGKKRIEDDLRISIGTADEMTTLIAKLSPFLDKE